VAVELLKLFEKFEVAVPPLLAAMAPASEAEAPPELLLLLSVLVLWFLLSDMLFELLVLLLLLSEVLFELLVLLLLLLLLSVVVAVLVLVLVLLLLLSEVRVVVCVAVAPLSALLVSCAWALSENASVIAVTSKVLFIRVPLWV
jgi:hypothetical protein